MLNLAENLVNAGLTPKSIKPVRIVGITRDKVYNPMFSGPKSLVTIMEQTASTASDRNLPVKRKNPPRAESSAISTRLLDITSHATNQ